MKLTFSNALYTFVVIILFCYVLFQRTIFYIWLVKCAGRIHNRLLNSLVHGKIDRFEEEGFIGKLANHFSKDQTTMDDTLPFAYSEALGLVTMSIFSVLLSCFVNMWFVIIVIPTVWYFIWARNFFMPGIRQLKRLESIMKSPLLAHINDTEWFHYSIRIEIWDFNINEVHENSKKAFPRF